MSTSTNIAKCCSNKAVDVMDSYKGKPYPSPVYVISGVIFGFGFPNLLAPFIPLKWILSSPTSYLSTTATELTLQHRTESVLAMLEAFILLALLFFVEFQCGVNARSTSIKASFSPAAAQASGIMPFCLIESNRIHQNQIEAACMYVPAALAATAAGANVQFMLATVVTWTVARIFYRLGYIQESPLSRAFGLFASYVQFFLCLVLWIYRKTLA